MVSIKNIPAGGSDKVAILILISIVVHALLLILFSNFPVTLSWPDAREVEKKRPLTVELLEPIKTEEPEEPKEKEEEEKNRTIEIVDLPDDPSKDSTPPEEIVRYANELQGEPRY